MSVSKGKTVREVALEIPAATQVLEELGIDYCCGGSKSLEQACQAANVPVDQVLDSLESVAKISRSAPQDRNWQTESLASLIAHIQNTHHQYTRIEIARLGPLFDKVCSAHGKNHVELQHIRETFAGLAQELTAHMMKEERVLFPHMTRMEESIIKKEPVPPAPFGSVRNPVAMMMHEHDAAGNALRDMRQSAGNYAVPPDACLSYETLYKVLPELEADLHQHIHLENNILFPRAVEMEQGQ